MTTATDIIAAIGTLDREELAALLTAISARLLVEPTAPTGDNSARPTLVDVNTLASALDLPKSWLMAKARKGEIPSVKSGKYVRFDVAEVAAALRVTPANVDNCKHSR